MGLFSLLIYLLELKNSLAKESSRALKKTLRKIIRRSTKPFRKFSKTIENKNSLFFSCIAIVIFSILIRSSKDLGTSSAIYIEIYNRFLDGNNFNNIIGNSLPLFIALSFIPNLLSHLFDLNQLLSWQIFFNILPIFPTYFCYLILLRSNLDTKMIHLLTLVTCFVFFLPPILSGHNEIIVKYSYLQFLIFPLIFYRLVGHLKKGDHFAISALGSIIIYIDPLNLLLVAFLEIDRLRAKDKDCREFLIRIFMLIVCLCNLYFLSNIVFGNNSNIFLDTNLQLDQSEGAFDNFKFLIYPLLLIYIISYEIVKKNVLVNLLAISALIFGIESVFNPELVVIYYSIGLAYLMLIFIALKNKTNWKSRFFFLLVILIFTFSDTLEVYRAFIELSIFWWLIVIFMSAVWRNKNFQLKSQFTKYLAAIFLPRKFDHWINLICLSLLTIVMSFYSILHECLWLFSFFMLALLLTFYQQINKSNNLNILSSIIACVIISHFTAMSLTGLIPSGKNPARQELVKYIKKYAGNKDDQVIIISDLHSDSYPALSYLDKRNNFIDFSATLKNNKDTEWIVESIIKNQTKLLIIQNILSDDKQCSIGKLESLLKSQKFKDEFVANFYFVGRVTISKSLEREVTITKDQDLEILIKEEPKLFLNKEIIVSDFDIYKRR